MFVFKAAVVGAGVMGGEIAQVIAAADIPVLLKDVDQKFVDAGLEKAREVTSKAAAKLVEKGKLSEDAARAQVDRILGHITGTTSYEGFGDVDFVIEAVPEKMEIKHAVFADLDACTPGHAILASNTSGLSITEIGEITMRPDKVVGFHFFWPASRMRLIEVIEGDDTSPETAQAAANFALAIRKTPVRCVECPGFVVNRILLSTGSEVWRYQDESGASVEALDELLREQAQMPMGPFRVADMSGLDTTVKVANDLRDAYGDRFYVHQGMEKLVAEGHLGAKSGKGFYDHQAGGPEGGTSPVDDQRIVERFQLKAFVESCLVLEEGIAGVRDIDMGLMMGTGMIPGPFVRADLRGLDEVLAALEAAEDEWGEHFEPPVILRRLVAQGRLGAKSGQGFYPYPQVEPGYETAAVKLDMRGEVAVLWLDNPPANSLGGSVVEGFERAWEDLQGRGARAMVLASPNPTLFSAGADIKGFTQMDGSSGGEYLQRIHALGRAWESSRIVTIAAVNGMALGGGCEIAMACDVRIAGESASFGQPEINLGIIPGFGGTQRLPRLVGAAKALEMNTIGDPISAAEAYEFGLANRVVPDHELFDAALAWARKVAGQAPVAIEQIKRLSHAGLDGGLAAERDGFLHAFTSEDAREGITAFIEKRAPEFKGR